MAGRSFKIKIGALWLTSDGAESGRACLVNVSGADAILRPLVGNTQIAASGKPFNESPAANGGAGRPLEMEILKLSTAVYQSLAAILDQSAESGAPVNVKAYGAPGDFDADCLVFYNPVYLSFGLFSAGSVRKVTVRLITDLIN